MSKEAVSQAVADVIAERQRQIETEGWSPKHDDAHNDFELSRAAACYALAPWRATENDISNRPSIWWPWDRRWWKPADPRRNLVKAGALILAEIERLDRLSQGA